ncbi:MAG TPA: preprotein translocase subunit SecA, partial [Clostridia bacterium]|nr:preprotein translocase subunit SecA [Clostridia bacterium]
MLERLKEALGFGVEAQLKPLWRQAEAIEALEPYYQNMSDEQLQSQTQLLKNRLNKGESLDDILNDAFALVREAAWRILGLRPFKVQLIGGIVLHQGRIAEMKTGE